MSKTKRKKSPKTVLKLPDLEHSNSSVLNSLPSQSSQRSYDHAIREFIEWYCSEPALASTRSFDARYRIFLEQAQYASSTIKLRLAGGPPPSIRRRRCRSAQSAPRRGIRRVRGAKKFGVSDRQMAHRRTR